MKRIAFIILFILVAINLGLIIHDFAPAGTVFGPQGTWLKAHDFLLRRNEARSVLSGIDPYKIWTEEVVVEPYYPFIRPELRSPTVDEPINAYTPWEYSYAFAYAALPKQVSWFVHYALMFVAFACVVCWAFRRYGCWAAVAALSFVIPANLDFNAGNYALIITAVIVGSAECLNRKKNLSAGLLWTIAMFKPQLGLPLCVPFLIARKWSTISVAVFMCCFLMIPAVVLTGVSTVTLLLEAPAASAHAFEGCALMPAPLLKFLSQYASPRVWMAVSMFVGICVCVAMTWRLRKCGDWFVLIFPSLLCAVGWTYVQPHSFVLTIPVAAWMMHDLVVGKTSGRYLLGLPSIFLLAGFARGAEIVVGKVLPSLAPIAAHITSLSATIAFVLTTAYILRYFKVDNAHKHAA